MMDWLPKWRVLSLVINLSFIIRVISDVSTQAASECRNIVYSQELDSGKALLKHVVDEMNVENDQMCRVMCYVNHDCVSYNLGPSSTPGMMICQLNDADRYQYPQDYQDRPGYSYRGSENQCAENPCTTANQTCQTGFNTIGYRCICPKGFTGVNCEIDIDECSSNGHNCSPYAECINIPGSFQCKCLPGYLEDGISCIEIDECSLSSLNNCSFYATCTNTPGSFQCTCKPKFTGDGVDCNGNGQSCEYPAKTCSFLKAAFPATASGVYCLDTESNSAISNNSFLAYCDMETEGGGWTLVWSYTFVKYDAFDSSSNAVTPGPKSLGRAILSDTAPQSETDYNAMDFLLWPSIRSEFMVKSNINNWIACVPGRGSLVTKTKGSLACRMVKVINNMCTGVPARMGYSYYGINLQAYYYLVTDTLTHWPTHDPCGRNEQNQLKNIPNPHGNIYLR